MSPPPIRPACLGQDDSPAALTSPRRMHLEAGDNLEYHGRASSAFRHIDLGLHHNGMPCSGPTGPDLPYCSSSLSASSSAVGLSVMMQLMAGPPGRRPRCGPDTAEPAAARSAGQTDTPHAIIDRRFHELKRTTVVLDDPPLVLDAVSPLQDGITKMASKERITPIRVLGHRVSNLYRTERTIETSGGWHPPGTHTFRHVLLVGQNFGVIGGH